MKKSQLLCFFLLVSAHAFSQKFTATLDTNRILIGQQTTLQLTASGVDAMADLVWPTFVDTSKTVEVLSQTRDTILDAESQTIVEKIVLTSFDSGFVVLPPLDLRVGEKVLQTEPLLLHIGTVELNPDQELFAIKDPVKAPIDWWYWFKKLWLVAVILAAAIAAGLWLWLRKRNKTKAAQETPDLRTPAERATDNLTEIKNALLWQHGEIKTYYSQVTQVVRVYVEEAYGVKALEAISDELLAELQPSVSTEAHGVIARMLATADAVKFAKMIPGPDQHTQLLTDAFEFVKLTTPKPTPNAD